MKNTTKQMKIWRAVAIIALCALLAVSILYAFGVGCKSSTPVIDGKKALSLWNDGTGARDALIDYVSAVTQEGGGVYIPVEDRIAVFDMDGTLTCETFYTYYDTMMFIEYCLNDHPERVSDELKAVAASIQPGYVADETLARNFAKAYAGMTVEEFYDYVVEFGQKNTASFNNMRYSDGFYLPMVELVKYLYDNGFEIWVISGTERTTTRAIVANSPIKDYVEPEHVIGTDFEVKQRGHEDEPSNMNFKYENGDELVLTGGFIQKNLNGNKSIWIEQEIGQRPVLAFGNSGSDTSMMNYAVDERNPYRAQAYMVVADDSEREWGTQDWETKSADYLAKGYIPISMKNDFAAIYPDGVTKGDEQYVPAAVQPSAPEIPAQDALDYGAPENWAYFELGEDRNVDVFLICPTVDTRSETNSFDLNDKLRGNFIYALDLERGIFEETGRLFSPFYRQMSINAYTLPEAERENAREIAYADISAAFRWYLDNENDGRGIILAGFSQGGEMCLELLKEYYGGDSAEAQALREQLIAVYSIGWMVTEEMTETYPQIIPAAGETDTGTVICFDCEDGTVSETIIIPAGIRALSINPLNWKTDSTPADKAQNHGAVFEAGGEPVPELCGAYIGERGELIVTDVTASDYPPGLDIFPEGAYHLYDYMFFFTNLKENVAVRTAAWIAGRETLNTAEVTLSDDASDFVLLSEAVPDAILEIRYYSTYNFVGDRIDGYEEPLAMLTTEAAAALKEVSDELLEMGYRLKIFDAYRPQMAVTHFMNWALDPDDTRMKEYFYPDLDKDVLFPQGYIAEHSGHSRGSTVDLTLFDMNTEREVDMGGTFDFFGELSHPDYTGITEDQYAMRMLLREVMIKHGFRPLPEEWWHFTLENEPYPDTYFTFPINSEVIGRSGSAPLTDKMKFDDGVDLSAEDGADSVERDGDHADSPYFSHPNFYDLESTDTLTILPHFKTIQQSSEWSCGVASSLMVLEWYGLRGDYTEESLAALRPQGLEPGATSLSEMVAMFDGVGGFTCYSAIDAGEDVHDIFTFDFIRDTLAAGDPILIGWNDWGGHWQVIIGYDTMGTETTQDDVIIVADPYDTTDHDQDGYGIYGAERFLYNFTFYNFFEGDELNDMCFLVAKPA